MPKLSAMSTSNPCEWLIFFSPFDDERFYVRETDRFQLSPEGSALQLALKLDLKVHSIWPSHLLLNATQPYTADSLNQLWEQLVPIFAAQYGCRIDQIKIVDKVSFEYSNPHGLIRRKRYFSELHSCVTVYPNFPLGRFSCDFDASTLESALALPVDQRYKELFSALSKIPDSHVTITPDRLRVMRPRTTSRKQDVVSAAFEDMEARIRSAMSDFLENPNFRLAVVTGFRRG